MYQGARFLFFVLLCAICTVSFAQEKPAAVARYFLNKQEISPQSVFFLNEHDIDSIGEYINPDTSIVFYMRKNKKMLSYPQLLKRYHLEDEVINFSMSTTFSRKISKPELMMFSFDTIADINISRNDKTGLTYVFIQSALNHWERDSKRAFTMGRIKRKLNDIR
jgi:hypothetical protein